jgi:integrase
MTQSQKNFRSELISHTPEIPHVNIASAFDLYVDLQSTYVSKKTVRDIYRPTKNSLLRFFGERDVEDLKSVDLVRWVQHELRERKREPRGINITIRTVRAFGNFLGKQRILPKENPFSEVQTLRVNWTPPVCISSEEFGKIYEKETDERYRLAFLLAFHTGLRRSDVAGLRWEHIDLERGYIRLPMMKTRRIVVIPFSPVVREILLFQRAKTEGLLFVWGRPIPSDKLGKRFKDACRKAKLGDYHFHHLRSSFASHLARLRVSPQRIATLLGHTSMTLVYSTYAHLSPESMENDVALIPVSTGSVPAIGSPEPPPKTTGSV